MFRPDVACISTLGLLLLFGCGGSELEKAVVSGQVIYDGQPVANGEILFYPTQGTKGPVSGASIKDGRYVAEGKGGVPVGMHTVRIQAYMVDEAARQKLVRNPDAMVSRQQYLPEKYNLRSDLTLEVPAGSGSLERNFVLPH